MGTRDLINRGETLHPPATANTGHRVTCWGSTMGHRNTMGVFVHSARIAPVLEGEIGEFRAISNILAYADHTAYTPRMRDNPMFHPTPTTPATQHPELQP